MAMRTWRRVFRRKGRRATANELTEDSSSAPPPPCKPRLDPARSFTAAPTSPPPLPSRPPPSPPTFAPPSPSPSLSWLPAACTPPPIPPRNPRRLTAAAKMATLLPAAAATMTNDRREAVKLAKQQEETVRLKCSRNNVDFPPYTFEELIGKGSFGRVYRCHHTETRKVVAIKVIDIDDADFMVDRAGAEEQIKDFYKEVRILKDIRELRIPNLNLIIEALSVHSQLWMICEHVQGGSVKTLMRATNGKLNEKFIIPVAREVAKALAGLHKAGYMHRDVKAANVLVHETGSIQLCDFGIATAFAHHGDKRKTFVGTLHYMAPEIFADDSNREYDFSVDTWAFGCALYEMATGNPPNADIAGVRQLSSRMRRLNKSYELPTDVEYSQGLRKLVADILTPQKANRLTMEDILDHECLRNTETSHPTESLQELVQEYYAWAIGGGNRASLFIPYGARGAEAPGAAPTSADDFWNFDVSTEFSNRMSRLLNIPDISQFNDDSLRENDQIIAPEMAANTAVDKKNFERRVERGGQELQNIFDPSKPDYQYKAKKDFVPLAPERRISDLPLRATEEDRPISIASNVIDLGDFDSEGYRAVDTVRPEIKLADPATIRAARSNSKLFKDASSESLPQLPSQLDRPSSVEIDAPFYEAALDDSSTARPPTQDFSFPPKEWKNQSESEADSEIEAGPSRDQRDKKHKTMEWSFASAMKEVESDQEATASSGLGAPPPLLRSTTDIVTARDRWESAIDERPGTAVSETETETDPFHFDQDQHSRFQNDALDLALSDPTAATDFYGGGNPSVIADNISGGLMAPPMNERAPVPARPLQPFSVDRPSVVQRMGEGGRMERGRSGGPSFGIIEFPDIEPPSTSILGRDASPEELEAELSGLLSGLVEGLGAAETALSMTAEGRTAARGSSRQE